MWLRASPCELVEMKRVSLPPSRPREAANSSCILLLKLIRMTGWALSRAEENRNWPAPLDLTSFVFPCRSERREETRRGRLVGESESSSC